MQSAMMTKTIIGVETVAKHSSASVKCKKHAETVTNPGCDFLSFVCVMALNLYESAAVGHTATAGKEKHNIK